MVSPCRLSPLFGRAVPLRIGEVVRRVRYRVSAVPDRDDEEGQYVYVYRLGRNGRLEPTA